MSCFIFGQRALVWEQLCNYCATKNATVFQTALELSQPLYRRDSGGNSRRFANHSDPFALKLKDIAALQKLISDEYMTMNFESELSDKENEIATAKTGVEWTTMRLEEIHTRVFGNTGIASGILSAQGKRPDGTTFSARVRFLAALVKTRGRLATRCDPIDPD